jgi:zinc/manganese transport system substrate-binding protein
VTSLRLLSVAAVAVLAACGGPRAAAHGVPEVVVTTPVLGAVVKELVGDAARVEVLMPNGADPHEWSPSARDVERLQSADVVVENGLGLEGSLQDAVAAARANGVVVFSAGDHVRVRHVGAGEGVDLSDADQKPGASDPHLWMDPLAMRDVVTALSPVLASAGIDVGLRTAGVAGELEALDAEVRDGLAVVPPERRKLVTGHESLGYFADRYGFTVVGTVVPGVSSQGEPSAGDLARLTATLKAQHVPALFSEVGTPRSVVRAVASDTGAAVIELSTHSLPADGSYRTFLLDIAKRIVGGLAT